MKLSDLKKNKDILLFLLSQKKEGQHLKCPFHEDKNGSMAIWNNSNVWFWKCHSGCGSGTSIDAAMKLYNCSSPADALKALEKEQGITIIRDEETQEPIIDHHRAEIFIKNAHNYLMDNYDLRTFYCQKRKIFNIKTLEDYRIGFVERQTFKEWRSWDLTGWVLPITNARGEVLGVKLHQEKRIPNSPKCLWCPFGTYPMDKPKNGTMTIWPDPSLYQNKNFVILAPGELKALALIDAGFQAISPTAGESKLPERIIKKIVDCNFGKIFINYDSDHAGREFRDHMIKELSSHGVLAIPYSYSVDINGVVDKNNNIESKKNEIDSSIEKEFLFARLDELHEEQKRTGIKPIEMDEIGKKLTLKEKEEWMKK